MNEMITEGLKITIMVLAIAVTVVLIPYLKSKIGEDKWAKLQEYTVYAVRYAEQIYTPEEWQKKKRYVYDYILTKAEDMGLPLSEQDIDTLVEGIVNLIKKG